MQPLEIPEPVSANAIEKMFGETEFILNGGNASGYSEPEHVIKQGLSLPAVKRVVAKEIEKRDSKVAEMLSDI